MKSVQKCYQTKTQFFSVWGGIQGSCMHRHVSEDPRWRAPVLKEEIKMNGKLEDIFGENIPIVLLTTLLEIRERYMQERALENN